MSIRTDNRNGRYEAVYRRRPGKLPLRLLQGFAVWAGLALTVAPMLIARTASGLSLGGLVAIQILLLVAAWRLLAEASRRDHVRIRLHLGSGELEIRSGRTIFSRTCAFGAVEAETVLLHCAARGEGEGFGVSLVTRVGPPVALIPVDPDEVSCRETALVISQGVGVALEDRRYAGGWQAPVRVSRSGEDRWRVLSWSYRDRFRPRAGLLGLGFVASLSAALPLLAEPLGMALLLPAGLDLVVALGLAAHALANLATRRITLRPDAVRVERLLSTMPLLQRLVPFEMLKGVVVLKRGPRSVVHLRLANRRAGVVLPFEEPSVAGWLKQTLEWTAHRR